MAADVASWRVEVGDCLDLLERLPADSVDAVVTDPPYGLEFMGQDWDKPWAVGFRQLGHDGAEDRRAMPQHGSARNPVCRTCRKHRRGSDRCRCDVPDFDESPADAMRAFQAWSEQWARAALRVLKPGGHMIAAGGSRTFHRLVAGVEDAGFEIRDTITWHYGQGWPKSRNVSAQIDALPACACEVPHEVGAVDASLPPGAVRAGAGAEPGAVRPAGLAAHAAGGLGPEPGAGAPERSGGVDADDDQFGGQRGPVVLGAPGVAGPAEGDEVGGDVRGVELEPESLGDEVVGDEPLGGGAVGAGPVAGDDGGADHAPASPAVLPASSAPRGVARPTHALAVGGSHAVAGAEGARVDVAGEGFAAPGADVGEARHPRKCPSCGGRIGETTPGLGTALKPATEFWTLARKPFRGTVEEQVLATGTGALNIDACRIDTGGEVITAGLSDPANRRGIVGSKLQAPSDADRNQQAQRESLERANALGRWPANVLLLHGPDCERLGTTRVRTAMGTSGGDPDPTRAFGGSMPRGDGREVGYGDEDGMETVEAWRCAPGCPVAELDALSGELRSGDPGVHRGRPNVSPAYGDEYRPDGQPMLGYGDRGGASRFFYSGKANPREREYGLDDLPEGLGGGQLAQGAEHRMGRSAEEGARTRERPAVRNVHPTVKPLDLMRWLIRLVTPPGGVVLDPFTGSGSTGCAAALEGVAFIGFERDETYAGIARRRIEAWAAFPPGTPVAAVLDVENGRQRAADEAEERRRELASAGQLDLLASGGLIE